MKCVVLSEKKHPFAKTSEKNCENLLKRWSVTCTLCNKVFVNKKKVLKKCAPNKSEQKRHGKSSGPVIFITYIIIDNARAQTAKKSYLKKKKKHKFAWFIWQRRLWRKTHYLAPKKQRSTIRKEWKRELCIESKLDKDVVYGIFLLSLISKSSLHRTAVVMKKKAIFSLHFCCCLFLLLHISISCWLFLLSFFFISSLLYKIYTFGECARGAGNTREISQI